VKTKKQTKNSKTQTNKQTVKQHIKNRKQSLLTQHRTDKLVVLRVDLEVIL